MQFGQSLPPRPGARAAALSMLALAALAVGASAGCASTGSYRVPGQEVQRLANLPPQERGSGIRVVPEAAPLYPSTQRVAPPPPPPVGVPPPGAPVYGPEVVRLVVVED